MTLNYRPSDDIGQTQRQILIYWKWIPANLRVVGAILQEDLRDTTMACHILQVKMDCIQHLRLGVRVMYMILEDGDGSGWKRHLAVCCWMGR